MIDTDKYEGHTPANLWGREIVAEGKRKIFLNTAWLSSIGNDVYSNEKDRLLMADAPLLLAEVLRLRPMADELIAIWEILEEDYPHVDRVIVKELIERKIGDYCEVKE